MAVLLLAGTSLQLVTPQITRFFIDTAQAGGAVSALTLAAGLYLGVALLSQVVSVVETYAAEHLGWTATNALRADLVQHSVELPMSFHNAHAPGELIERIDGDVSELANFFSRFVLQLLGSAALLIGVLALLWREEWRVGLALTLVSIVALVALNAVRARGTRYSWAARQASADLFGFLEERLAGLRDIQALGGQRYVLGRLYPYVRAHFQNSRTAFLMGGVLGSAVSAVFTVGWVLVFAMGAYFYRAGTMSIGTVFLLVQYMAMLRRPLDEIGRQAQDFQRAGASVARIAEFRATAPMLPDGPALDLPAGPPRVEFRAVSFGYGAPDAPVVKDVSFVLEPGRVLGILGRTGSGKTTLTRLLLRLYEPDAGSVYLGGVDLRQVGVPDLRRHIGVVPQDVQLFQASVRDNLTLFDPDIPRARIFDIVDELGLGPWLSALPNGLDAEIVPDHAGLSAGEAQLLAFVRVFLRDPGLVILDEAASRLDPATERLIDRAVDRLFHQRTGIVIAHRLQTVERADDILILRNGRVAEWGPREKLAGVRGSLFHELLLAGAPSAVLDGSHEEAHYVARSRQ